MAALGVHKVLVINVINLLCLYYLSLTQKLQGHILASFFVFCDLYLPETSLPKDSTYLIILELQFLDILAFGFLHKNYLNVDYKLIENKIYITFTGSYTEFKMVKINLVTQIQMDASYF